MTTSIPPVEEFDVVIIGAGINGAGLFHDLCHQGVKCLLVEKRDFGAGTSAAPSRLIHGGLKYLETGEFRLVRESTYERNLLLMNAPHLVKPLQTVIPIRSWANGVWSAARTFFGFKSVFQSRGALLIKIGLMLYDFFGRKGRVMPKHKMLSKRSVHKKMPSLTNDIVGVGIYYDAMVTAPERLILELVEDGCAAQSESRAINWTALIGSRDDELIFQSRENEETCARPKILINAAGPWIDDVNQCLGETTHLIGGTKGSHIIIKHDELISELDGKMVYFEGDDGRILLVFPYQGAALVGSTDIPATNPDDLKCDDLEVDYFMAGLASLFPALNFTRDQILYSYAGIRPLPNSEGVAPGLISRDHSAPIMAAHGDRPYPIIPMIGGKWTTYRGFAESVAEVVALRLGVSRPVKTQFLKIGGGAYFPSTPIERQAWVDSNSLKTKLSGQRLSQLLDRYGSKASEIAKFESNYDGNRVIIDIPSYTVAEIDWIIRNERVQRLEDIVLRRTLMAVTGQLTKAALLDISDVASKLIGWTNKERGLEIESIIKMLASQHNVNLT